MIRKYKPFLEIGMNGLLIISVDNAMAFKKLLSKLAVTFSPNVRIEFTKLLVRQVIFTLCDWHLPVQITP